MWRRSYKMNRQNENKLLQLFLRTKGYASLTVSGSSMEPSLHSGDIVTIEAFPVYNLGDILVYSYKNEGLLIHRLLKQESRYYCKGDNSFRLEDISFGDIIGKVVSVNNQPIIPWRDWEIQLSYSVSRQFLRCMYDKTKTTQTDIYKLYNTLILQKENNSMIYQKNLDLDYIYADASSLAVFNPENSNTYFFDETGIDILNILTEPCDLNSLLERLCQIYDATPEEIRSDVEEFLAETIQKKVIKMQ